MATSKEEFEFFKEKLAFMPEIMFRAMMGEYVLYYNGKVVGGIYDNRILVKPVEDLKDLLPDAQLQLPYAGAKPQIYIEDNNFEKPDLLRQIFETVYSCLPDKKKKR